MIRSLAIGGVALLVVFILGSCSGGGGNGDTSVSALTGQFQNMRTLAAGQRYDAYEPVQVDLMDGASDGSVEFRNASGYVVEQRVATNRRGGEHYMLLPPVLAEVPGVWLAEVKSAGNTLALGQIIVSPLPQTAPNAQPGYVVLAVMDSFTNSLRDDVAKVKAVISQSSLTSGEQAVMLQQAQQQLTTQENSLAELRQLVDNGVPIVDANGATIVDSSSLTTLDRTYLALLDQFTAANFSQASAGIGDRQVLNLDDPLDIQAFADDLTSRIKESVRDGASTARTVLGYGLFGVGLAAAATGATVAGGTLAFAGAVVYVSSTVLPTIITTGIDMVSEEVTEDTSVLNVLKDEIEYIARQTCSYAVNQSIGFPGGGSICSQAERLVERSADFVEDAIAAADSFASDFTSGNNNGDTDSAGSGNSDDNTGNGNQTEDGSDQSCIEAYGPEVCEASSNDPQLACGTIWGNRLCDLYANDFDSVFNALGICLEESQENLQVAIQTGNPVQESSASCQRDFDFLTDHCDAGGGIDNYCGFSQAEIDEDEMTIECENGEEPYLEVDIDGGWDSATSPPPFRPVAEEFLDVTLDYCPGEFPVTGTWTFTSRENGLLHRDSFFSGSPEYTMDLENYNLSDVITVTLTVSLLNMTASDTVYVWTTD